MSQNQTKRRTNVSIDAALLDQARALHLNVSAITEAAIAVQVRQAQADAWVLQNRDAMAQRRRWIAENGAPLTKWQSWTPE